MSLQLTQSQSGFHCLQREEGKQLRNILSLKYRLESKHLSLLLLKQLYHHLIQNCSQTYTLLATLQLLQHLTRVASVPYTPTTEALCSYVLTLLQKETELLRSCVDTATDILKDLIHSITCLCQNRRDQNG